MARATLGSFLGRYLPSAIFRPLHTATEAIRRIIGYALLNPRFRGGPLAFMRGLLEGARQLHHGRRILFYPRVPRSHSGYLISKVVLRNGYRTVTDPGEPYDLAVKWLDQTFAPNDDILRSLAARGFVLNGGCVDNSKATVDELHQEVFGYGLTVDPTSWRGRCVRKPNLNGAGSGSLIDCPIPKPDAGFVYQRFVDSLGGDGYQEEMRVTLVGNDIPVVRVRSKPFHPEKIKDKHPRIMVRDATSVFTSDEIARIVHLTHRVGIHFGELDVIRDRHDGRIYVVDVNDTAWGSPRALSQPDWLRVVGVISEAFDAAFFGPARLADAGTHGGSSPGSETSNIRVPAVAGPDPLVTPPFALAPNGAASADGASSPVPPASAAF